MIRSRSTSRFRSPIALLTLAGCLFPVAPVVSQHPEAKVAEALLLQAQAQSQLSVARATAKHAKSRTMYEDIEIMRRLLTRRLRDQGVFTAVPSADWAVGNYDPSQGGGGAGTWAVGQPGTATYSATSPTASWSPWVRVVNTQSSSVTIAPEGTYLPNHGVVYTLTLPMLKEDPRPQTAKPDPAKPLSDWEHTRKEVRGEVVKPRSGVLGVEVRRPSLGDLILDALAEHGKNFSQLGENERITLAVTFRDAATSVSAEGTFYWDPGLPPRAGSSGKTYRDVFSVVPGQAQTTENSWISKQEEGFKNLVLVEERRLGNLAQRYGQDHPKVREAREQMRVKLRAFENQIMQDPQSGRDFKLLGDLHLKQGKPRDALASYESAFERLPVSERKQELGKDLLSKMAQAALETGDHARAKQLLEALVDSTSETKPADDKMAQVAEAKPEPSPLPAKLIISAPKKLLDEVGHGKISRTEFKKRVSIQYLTFGEKKAGATSDAK